MSPIADRPAKGENLENFEGKSNAKKGGGHRRGGTKKGAGPQRRKEKNERGDGRKKKGVGGARHFRFEEGSRANRSKTGQFQSRKGGAKGKMRFGGQAKSGTQDIKKTGMETVHGPSDLLKTGKAENEKKVGGMRLRAAEKELTGPL